MNKSISFFIALMGCLLLLGACRKQIKPTTVEIKDPVRHYYPVLQGQELKITFLLTNTGDYPLVINDIQSSCGCIMVNKKSNEIIPPGIKKYVYLTYNSTKNIGYVSHSVRVYGNIEDTGVAEFKFDLNVVPDAEYTPDYEDLFKAYNLKNGIVTKFFDGNEAERGYYVDEP